MRLYDIPMQISGECDGECWSVRCDGDCDPCILECDTKEQLTQARKERDELLEVTKDMVNSVASWCSAVRALSWTEMQEFARIIDHMKCCAMTLAMTIAKTGRGEE